MSARRVVSAIVALYALLLASAYLISALISMLKWACGLMGAKASLPGLIPADIGFSAFAITVSLLLMYGAVEVEGKDIYFLVGSSLAVAGMVLQLMVAAANAADALIASLVGEVAEYSAAADLMRPDVMLGAASLPLLMGSLRGVKRLVGPYRRLT